MAKKVVVNKAVKAGKFWVHIESEDVTAPAASGRKIFSPATFTSRNKERSYFVVPHTWTEDSGLNPEQQGGLRRCY